MIKNILLINIVCITCLLLSGCVTSQSDLPISRGIIPPLDPRDEQICHDPGVNDGFVETLTNTRFALIECKRKHKNVVDAYEAIRLGI